MLYFKLPLDEVVSIIYTYTYTYTHILIHIHIHIHCSANQVKKILGSWDNASAMGMSGITVNGLR